MSDARLRELERRWREEGSPVDGGAFLRERLRRGDLTLARLELAAYCGDEAALHALDGAIEPHTARANLHFMRLMPGWWPGPWIALTAAELALPVWERRAPNDRVVAGHLARARQSFERGELLALPGRPDPGGPRRRARARNEDVLRWARRPPGDPARADRAALAALRAAWTACSSLALASRGAERDAFRAAEIALDDASLARAERPATSEALLERARATGRSPEARAAEQAWSQVRAPVVDLVAARLRAWALAVT